MEEKEPENINIQGVFLTAGMEEMEDLNDKRPSSPRKYSEKIMSKAAATKARLEE